MLVVGGIQKFLAIVLAFMVTIFIDCLFSFEELSEIHLLALVVDATPSKKIASQGGFALLRKTLDSVITFGNAHLMQSTLNKLTVLACNSSTT